MMIQELLGSAALLMSLLEPLQRREIPVTELNAPFVGFTCSKNGLPTVRMEHQGERGLIHFGQYDPAHKITFDLRNSVQSVAAELENGERRWIVLAEGIAQQVEGLPSGTRATILLTVREDAGGRVTGDFAVRAGSFSTSETGCGPMPVPTRLLGQRQ